MPQYTYLILVDYTRRVESASALLVYHSLTGFSITCIFNMA